MAQNGNGRDYRRGAGRSDNEVSFRDGKPVTYSSRQERGGRRPEASDKPYYKRDNDDKSRPYYKKDGDNQSKPYYKKDGDNQSKPYYKKDGDRSRPYGNRAEGEGDKPFYKKRDNAEGRFDKAKREDASTKAKAAPVQDAAVQTDAMRQDELPFLVMGRNAVKEAVKSGRSIDKLLVNKEPDGSLREIINLARDRNIRVDEVNREKLDEMCMPFGHGGKTGNHQGIVAQVPGVEYCEIADILDAAKEKGEKPFVIILDGIEDPHNLGSIIRSAVCAGAHGVIIPRRRAVSVTAAASKASAGAVEYAKVARVANIASAIARLKDEGVWIAGADMGGMPMGRARMEGALALVIGSEGDGISRLVKEKCDFLVSIPMSGPIDSLNAAVAAAILMFEKRRQDGDKVKKE